MARRRFMPTEIEVEIRPFARCAPTAGFFTYGEFYRFEERAELLNETMTGVALSESEKKEAPRPVCVEEEDWLAYNPADTFEAMANLIRKSSEELNTLISLFSQSDIVLFQWNNDEEWSVSFVSQNVERILGYDRYRFLSGELRYADLIHPDDLPRVVQEVTDAVTKSLESFAHEPYRVRRGDGRYIWVEDKTKVEYDEQGRAVHFIGFISDITERLEAQKRLELHALIFENASEAIVITDAENRIIAVNPAFEKITGYTAEEAIGQNPRILKSGEHDSFFYEKMWEALLERDEWQGEVVNLTKYGDRYVAWLSIRVIRDASGKVTNYLALQTDITDLVAMRDKLETLAHYDSLTHLPNRFLFKDRFNQAIVRHRRSGKRLALLYLDLDNFKNVNDSLGHMVGDELLQMVARRLEGALRANDTVSRQGGDEFLILLEELRNRYDAKLVVEKLVEAMREPFKLGDEILHVTFSIGVAIYPDDGTTFDELLQHADLAMYAAKHDGKNTYRFFERKMLEKIQVRHHLSTKLRHALEREELTVYYQPKLDLKTRRVKGMEALLRWEDPVDGFISPALFVSIAEESGLIVEMGDWVLEQACRMIKRLEDRYAIAVNISAKQFEKPDFVESIEKLLKKHRIDPALLELELTETMLIQNIEASLDAMARLKRIGVSLAIDDFGTGYSSLAYLKRFPADVLKVDRSFVNDVEKDPDDAVIVDAIIQLGHTFSMTVVAEGVETEGQLAFLESHGCDEIQGYLFAKPMPAKQLLAFLEKQAAQN
jgi:diguanylate cyclase (GGDEF)-like protein/PAS domain S-box-containing protein